MSRFSDTLMDHFQAPRNRGRLDSCDRLGTAGVVGHGPFVAFYLKLAEGRVTQAAFECNACGVTVAICSAVTELIQARTIEACRTLTPDEVLHALDGVPPDKRDRIPFVLGAIQNALADDLQTHFTEPLGNPAFP